ncbi:N-acyl amino acid synthase FeeM domain-containing protein [Noviherbaspirillum aerium]|uniref:N-acyl amino acid synthase FeeM domain-containing protein n=1 Tax=Noviherbaspirillum aerium TaxID=2588497 RepID=UPI00124E4501|nr:hypothetical protein [Noviherbaspirillum aerium]
MHTEFNLNALKNASDKNVAAPAFAVTNMQMKQERLPFTIKIVENDIDLYKAVQIRHQAYARHVPAFAESLRSPEAADYADDTVVLLAESKLDGSPLGSVRIQTNAYRSLSIEKSVVFPDWLEGYSLAEVTRLGIEEGRVGRIVKIALIKACFEYCARNGIDYAVAAGRAPIDRHYEQLLFEDLFPETGFLPLQHAGNLPHRVMFFEIATGEQRWTAANHPLLQFFCHTHHPDIMVTSSAKMKSSHFRQSSTPRGMPETLFA